MPVPHARQARVLAAAAALLALAATPASAQFSAPGIDLYGSKRPLTAEEKEKLQQIDKDYQATMKKVPDKPKAYDPWAGARQDTNAAKLK